MRLVVAVMLCLALSGISFTTFAQSTENCPDTAPSRLTIGEEGRVLPGNPNNVREQPSRESLIIGKIPAEAVFTVLEGPTCADGVSWWQVDYDGLVGWTAEAVGFEYAVESLAPYTTEVEFLGVSFTLPSEIATGFQPDILPTDGVVPVPMPLPTRIEIAFEYADSSVGYANVRVMPVVEFNAMYPDLLDTVAEQLETRPEVPTLSDVIPFYPGNRAFLAQPAYVEFEGGAGIRAVSAFSLAVDPLSMNYLFIGLTDNGTHVVSIIVPVTSEATFAVEFDPENFETYLEDFGAVVDTIPADEFTPSLTLIDEMVSTLQIAPETLAAEIEAFNPDEPTVTVSCTVTPIADTNVRVSPDVNASPSGYAAANTEYTADRQYVRAGESYPWWHLVDDADVLPLGEGLPADGRWLRADFVKEEGDCDNLPQG
jgi:hypothetical protein